MVIRLFCSMLAGYTIIMWGLTISTLSLNQSISGDILILMKIGISLLFSSALVLFIVGIVKGKFS
jgi:hypothetical protein